MKNYKKLTKELSKKVIRRDVWGGIDCTDEAILCGLHSGIPECCVLFFINTWEKWFQTGNLRKIKQHNKNIMLSWIKSNKLEDILKEDDLQYYISGPNYVPCDKCVEKGIQKVKIKKCKCAENK